MKLKKSLAALALTAALLLTGCGQTEEKQEPAAVTIDGVTFTQAEYEGMYLYAKNMMDMQLSMYGIDAASFWGSPEKYNEQIALSAKQQLTLQAVLENGMKEAKLELDVEALDANLAQQEQQFGSAEELDEVLGKLHVSREQYRRMVSTDIMYQQLSEHIGESDAEAIRSFFDQEYLRCKHVLVADEEGDPEKEALAKEIAEKARNGADFDELVKEYGEDPGMASNPNGYTFTEGEMVEPFYEGAKALELNGISDPVQSGFGWHVIQRLPLGDEEFAASEAMVRDTYFGKQLSGWMENAEVTLTPEAEAVTFEALLPAEEEAPAEEAPAEDAPAEEK